MMEEPWNPGHYQPINLPAASASHSWNWSRPSSDHQPLLPAEVEIHSSSRDRLLSSVGTEEALHCEQLSHYCWPPLAARTAMERTIKEEEESYDVGVGRVQMIPVASPPHGFGSPAAGDDHQRYTGDEEAVVSRGMRGNYSLVLPSETISGSSSAAALQRRAEGGGQRATTDQFKRWSAMGAEEKEASVTNEGRGMKRGASNTNTTSAVLKKPRPEGGRSLIVSPFKVKKEKLGDRIAALQQLVAPFGKTDTASVLMEAIGYIKFLQDQVETLSVPYLRSSKSSKASYGVFGQEKGERRIDLRSKGLCLVPLSCTTYITNEMWGANYEH